MSEEQLTSASFQISSDNGEQLTRIMEAIRTLVETSEEPVKVEVHYGARRIRFVAPMYLEAQLRMMEVII